MAHKQQQDFIASIKHKFPEFFKSQQVLEIGSLNINGSVRVFFENCNYIGVDVGSGPDVDVIAQGQDLTYDDGMFDVVISTEVFEHTPHWREIFLNMSRMTRPAGLVIFTCASTGRREHGTRRTTPHDAPLLQTDYYKNLTRDDFLSCCDIDHMFETHDFAYNDQSHDLYFYGIRKQQ